MFPSPNRVRASDLGRMERGRELDRNQVQKRRFEKGSSSRGGAELVTTPADPADSHFVPSLRERPRTASTP